MKLKRAAIFFRRTHFLGKILLKLLQKLLIKIILQIWRNKLKYSYQIRKDNNFYRESTMRLHLKLFRRLKHSDDCRGCNQIKWWVTSATAIPQFRQSIVQLRNFYSNFFNDFTNLSLVLLSFT